MNEIILCPGCQRKLQIPENLVGQDVQCPTCSTTFQAALGPLPQPARPPEAPPMYRREREEESPRGRRGRRRYDEEDDDRPRRRRYDEVEPHRGGMILTLGILSIVFGVFFCIVGVVLGPVAWILGTQDLNAIQDGRMDPEGEGPTSAGKVCGIIGTLISILLLCFGGLIFFIGMAESRRF